MLRGYPKSNGSTDSTSSISSLDKSKCIASMFFVGCSTFGPPRTGKTYGAYRKISFVHNFYICAYLEHGISKRNSYSVITDLLNLFYFGSKLLTRFSGSTHQHTLVYIATSFDLSLTKTEPGASHRRPETVMAIPSAWHMGRMVAVGKGQD